MSDDIQAPAALPPR